MNRRLLLFAFNRALAILLLTTLFSGQGHAQSTTGYGDFIIFEDFGSAVRGSDDHERYSSRRNDGYGEVYFRVEPLDDIDPDNLLFYRPGNPPWQYEVDRGLRDDNNWGPQYIASAEMGSYSITTNSAGFRNQYFYPGGDHTSEERPGELGYMLLVDAHANTELYFDRKIDGLCEGTRFEFSAWVKNVNNQGFTAPTVLFEIVDADNEENIILESEATTNKVNEWEKIAAEFVMPGDVSSIRLRISNVVDEHTGNDIAIDDIGFRPMGPGLEFFVEQQLPACAGDPVIFTARVTEASEAYTENHFMLQRRPKGADEEDPWENVGEYQTSIGTDPVTFEVPATGAIHNYDFRVVVAGNPTALGNEYCSAVSESILLEVNHHQPEIAVTGGNAVVCFGEAAELIAAVSGGDAGAEYTYVWEQSTDEERWEVISGTTGATLNIGSLEQTTYYRVTARLGEANGCPGAGASSAFTVTVNPLPEAPAVEPTVTYVGAPGIGYHVTASAGHTLIWFDEEGNPLTPNEQPAVSTDEAGEFTAYVAQRNNETACISPIVPVKVFVKPVSVVVEKTVELSEIDESSELKYLITVENTGEYDLTGVSINDVVTQGGTSETLALDAPTGDNTNPGILDVGETWTYTVSYAATQAHIDNGADIVNTVSVTTTEGATDDAEAITEITRNPAIEIVKTADKSTVSTAGEVITYTLTVTNTGNTTLENYTVTDVLFPEWRGRIEQLLPGKSQPFTLEYTVTQTDIDNGGVVNVARVTGDNPGDPDDEDEVEIPSDKQPAIEIVKTADKSTVSTAGEVITYTLTVTNTGNTTLENYTVTDVLFPEWRGRIEQLLPGKSQPFTLEYTVTQTDIDNGGVVNVARVTGDNPGDPDDEDEIEVPVGKDASIKITKVADRESFSNVGDVITYTITVTNTGNITLSDVVVTDILFPQWREEIATLAPKANRSFELEYTVTAVDVEEDAVVNVANVNAKDPDGGTPGDETEIKVPGIFGPVATDDDASTNQGSPVAIHVVGNDRAGSKPIVPGTVRLIQPVSGDAVTTVTIEGEGTYTVGADGTVTFTPDADYVGVSTVTYTVKDENGLESNAAAIAVTVEGVAAEIAPSANDDQATAPYGQSATIMALANDQPGSSPIVPSTVRLIDASGNGATTVTVPGEGRYSVDAQGVVTFEPADGFTGISTVRYEVTDENGLVSNVATISVTVQSRPFKIPNVFTPNGDGRNDQFEIVGIESFDRVEITVVNRWGNEVYRHNNYKNDWDGQGLNEGTYYYVIITHDGNRQERYAGWVLIKKQ